MDFPDKRHRSGTGCAREARSALRAQIRMDRVHIQGPDRRSVRLLDVGRLPVQTGCARRRGRLDDYPITAASPRSQYFSWVRALSLKTGHCLQMHTFVKSRSVHPATPEAQYSVATSSGVGVQAVPAAPGLIATAPVLIVDAPAMPAFTPAAPASMAVMNAVFLRVAQALWAWTGHSVQMHFITFV
jgi:hypothetical protein